VIKGRVTANVEGDFVVFLIGARINQLWAVHKWLPVLRAMPRMLKELFRNPDLGLLHAEYFLGGRNVMVLQYWQSYEKLHAYAHAKDKVHLPAWVAFNQAARGNAAVGIYHESYLLSPGKHESVYANMPLFGLAKAFAAVPAVGSMQTASARLRKI
jgi:hypothetical protein